MDRHNRAQLKLRIIRFQHLQALALFGLGLGILAPRADVNNNPGDNGNNPAGPGGGFLKPLQSGPGQQSLRLVKLNLMRQFPTSNQRQRIFRQKYLVLSGNPQ